MIRNNRIDNFIYHFYLNYYYESVYLKINELVEIYRLSFLKATKQSTKIAGRNVCKKVNEILHKFTQYIYIYINRVFFSVK